ncbi:hypothetical protein SRRS_38410 [Sporomusa rhizae]|uniref:STAS domain-containing protein n=1 Tax=Sporomusa rhizae TaxID=357999 RepID=UPI00352B09B9
MNGNYEQITIDIGSECLAVNSDVIKDKILDCFIEQQQKEICFDFTNTKHMDAAGLGVIASLIFEGRRKRVTFSMKGATGSVLDMLTATGLSRILDLNTDTDQG